MRVGYWSIEEVLEAREYGERAVAVEGVVVSMRKVEE